MKSCFSYKDWGLTPQRYWILFIQLKKLRGRLKVDFDSDSSTVGHRAGLLLFPAHALMLLPFFFSQFLSILRKDRHSSRAHWMLHLQGIFKEMGKGAEVFKAGWTRSSDPVVLTHLVHPLCPLVHFQCWWNHTSWLWFSLIWYWKLVFIRKLHIPGSYTFGP